MEVRPFFFFRGKTCLWPLEVSEGSPHMSKSMLIGSVPFWITLMV